MNIIKKFAWKMVRGIFPYIATVGVCCSVVGITVYFN